MGEMIFTVDKICGYIKNIFDSETLLQNIEVSGEIGNYTESNSNAYFSLKGRDCQLPCVCFAIDLRKFIPKNGDSCIVRGSVTYYKKGGKISFYVTDMRPAGQGDSYLKFLQLKDRLEKEGLFEERYKVALPEFTTKIGVVTSRNGAVIHDIIKTASKKYPAIDIVLYSVKVQGVDAEKEISEGISAMDDSDVDVIIVARGGGSEEDFSAFNTEIVARAVFNCKKPVVSAVGHETDYTLCDLVSDVRVATPTAAAEITVQSSEFLQQKIMNIMSVINNSVTTKFNESHLRIKNILKGMFSDINGLIDAYLTDIKHRAEKNHFTIDKTYKERENFLLGQISRIDALNPLNVLRRGYSVITDEKGKAVKKLSDTAVGKDICIIMQDGKADAVIKKIIER